MMLKYLAKRTFLWRGKMYNTGNSVELETTELTEKDLDTLLRLGLLVKIEVEEPEQLSDSDTSVQSEETKTDS